MIQTLKGYAREVKPVAFAPNGQQLASTSNEETVQLWNTATRLYCSKRSGTIPV